jgi:Zn-dependent peptidase ImmA (M78 family)
LLSGQHLDPALSWARDKYIGAGLYGNNKELILKELRRIVFADVEKLIRETGQEMPFQPELLAAKRKVKSISEVELSKANALLVPEVGGFIIKIRYDVHPFQKRFACAHEIGHTYFFNIDHDPPRREYQHDKSAYWVEEDFSCAIARDILLPSFSIRQTVIGKLTPSISALRYLSRSYQASFDIIRKRIINDIPIWDCIVFRSTMSGEEIATKGFNISKGSSYQRVTIPNTIVKESAYGEMLPVFHAAQDEGFAKKMINFCGKQHLLETMRINDERSEFLSVLTFGPKN